ncbi:MAG: hypothetical protein WD404_08770 [Solirubrobacterales bacterium]
MLDYRPVGLLLGTEGECDLLLPEGRPLSYLRVDGEGQATATLARALLERRATEFRRRIPVIRPVAEGCEDLLEAFRGSGLCTVFPLLRGRGDDGSPLDVLWLDRVQALAFARRQGRLLRRRGRPVRIDGVKLSPTFESDRGSSGEIAEGVDERWQYWNSVWEFEQMPAGSERWWRVWPNENRDRGGLLGLSSRTAARGTSAACLAPRTLRRLGSPRYLVIEHPFRSGNLPVLALADERLEDLPGDAGGGVDRLVLCLDRTARDALGISDGEFCLVHPWLRPRGDVWRRLLRDRYVGSRAISANVRTSARADLEKPVCRLDEESLAAIGGHPGELVTLETLQCKDPEREGGVAERWERVRIGQRVVPIDGGERSRRSAWEAGQLWDDDSASPASWLRRESRLEPEGFVDCAETLGVHPAYPTVYLNFNARKQLGLRLCQPVEVRVKVVSRVMADLGNLVWLVLIGLIGTVAALLELSIGLIAAILGATLLLLLALRAIRTLR